MNNKKSIRTESNTKRIAKNSIMLYIRMFFILLIGLFTSRVLLNTLGVEDFGIYNLVGGFVTMFSVVRAGLVSAALRYFSYYLGKDERVELKRTFQSFATVYLILCIFILIVAETVGLWFLYNKLNIPETRFFAAKIVFQLSLFSLCFSLLSSPFISLIISRERMNMFTYISIYEVLAKLLIAISLWYSPIDSLIMYSLLLFFVSVSVSLLYICYCRRNFNESLVIFCFDIKKIKEIYGFASWAMIGGIANICLTQGLNILLGMFFTPAINAARGIAIQVQSVVSNFSNSFQTAIDPQIVKSYANNDYTYLHKLLSISSRATFLLMYIISLPLLLELDYVLNIWLGVVPTYTEVFATLIVLAIIIDTVSNPSSKAIMATGKIKGFSMAVNGSLLLILPISYVFLRLGYEPYSVFVVNLILNLFVFFVRLYFLEKQVNFKIVSYISHIILPIIFVGIVSSVIPVLAHFMLDQGFLRLIIVSLASTISIISFALMVGMSSNERTYVFSVLSRYIKK